MKQEKYVAYVGTYTHENSVGIHIYDVDVEAGKLTERKVVPINNPSDLVVSRTADFCIPLRMRVWNPSVLRRTAILLRSTSSGSAE